MAVPFDHGRVVALNENRSIVLQHGSDQYTLPVKEGCEFWLNGVKQDGPDIEVGDELEHSGQPAVTIKATRS